MSTPRDPLAISDVHLELPVTDRAAAESAYTIVLGAPADGRWGASNATVELVDAAAPLVLDFDVADLAAARTLLSRRGLTLADRGSGSAVEGLAPLGVRDRSPRPGPSAAGTVTGLDHVLIMHPDAESAIALFGGRLGLDLRLVRPIGDAAQLWFRTASTIVEVVAGESVADRERFGGVVWACTDIDAEHARITDAGLQVSDVRDGRKPGTRVCTIREAALAAPTLLIEHTPQS